MQQLQPPPIRTPFVDLSNMKGLPDWFTKLSWIFAWPWAKFWQQLFNVAQASQRNIVNVQTNYTAVAGDVVLVDSSSNDITVTLPVASKNVDAQIVVLKISSDPNQMLVMASDSNEVNGMPFLTFTTQFTGFQGYSDGKANWYGF